MSHFAMSLTEIYLPAKTAAITMLAGVLLLPQAEVMARRQTEPKEHAPCYDCEFYHLMQRDQGFHDEQVNIFS